MQQLINQADGYVSKLLRFGLTKSKVVAQCQLCKFNHYKSYLAMSTPTVCVIACVVFVQFSLWLNSELTNMDVEMNRLVK